MDKSEKRFERDIESFLISPEGGYTQFNGQDAEGNWIHTRQHDVAKCIYILYKRRLLCVARHIKIRAAVILDIIRTAKIVDVLILRVSMIPKLASTVCTT